MTKQTKKPPARKATAPKPTPPKETTTEEWRPVEHEEDPTTFRSS